MSLSILVADDHEHIRELIKLWLVAAEHSVTCVATGDAAMKLLSAQHFDLVVTDLIMPEGDGFGLIMNMKEAKTAARILAISGGGKFFQAETCLRMAQGLGANFTLLKPFGKKVFLAAVNRAMAPAETDTSGGPEPAVTP